MILLFTDAKPTDFDAYEGVHGIQDVAKAVSEARRLGIDIFAVTLDKAAQSHFTQMFGRNKFCVVNHPNDLANELMKIYMSALT
jgi:nitric oxide reductase NorD protein